MLNDKPLYYVGTNYWYGALLPLQEDPARGIERLRSELDFLQKKGITNLRVIAGAEGSGLVAGSVRIGPPLQPEKGVFDARVISGLDVLLAEMGKRNMKAVVYLSNNWEWSGGFLQYLQWNGKITDSVMRNKMDWETMRDVISQFYGCAPCLEDYLSQVKYVVGHTNTVTGTKYVDDPTIMAWQIANEPRPMRPYAIDDYKKFVQRSAALIKSMDKNHLLTVGTEGTIGTENAEVYKDLHSDKNVDYLTIHIWPKNWGWFTGKSMEHKMDSILRPTLKYIQQHEATALELNKPLVLEEFGLPRNGISFSIDTATTYRDIFYKNILATWQRNNATNGPLAGINFWAYGGQAKPVNGQVYWKPGDDFMGDPPFEEQGLYTVFNGDTSTWQIIESFTRKKALKKKD